MTTDDFEKQLARQEFRAIPGNWRAEILAGAKGAMPHRAPQRESRPAWLASLLWPNPKAWAALAAVWIVILTLHLSTRDTSPLRAEQLATSMPAGMTAFRDQQFILVEMFGPAESGPMDTPQPPPPRPRSERRRQLLMA